MSHSYKRKQILTYCIVREQFIISIPIIFHRQRFNFTQTLFTNLGSSAITSAVYLLLMDNIIHVNPNLFKYIENKYLTLSSFELNYLKIHLRDIMEAFALQWASYGILL